MRSLYPLGAVLITAFFILCVVVIWPIMPSVALIVVLTTVGFAIAFGGLGLYYFWWKIQHLRSQSYATMIEAAKVPDTIAALATPTTSRVSITVLPVRHQPAPALSSAQELEQSLPAAALTAPENAPSLLQHMSNTSWTPTRDRMLLGWTSAGPLYGSVEDLLSTAIAGRPKQGKTTLLRFITAQLMLAGGQLVVLDPHGSLADGSDLPAELIATSKGELDDAADWINAELDRRLAAYRKGQRDFTPLMVMADEWPVISLSSKDAVAAAQRVILEARKTNYYGLISGQGLPASNFGGSLARDALSSRYIFKTTAQQGRIAGLDKDTARMVERLERGQAIFEGPVNPVWLSIPNVTGNDLQRLLATTRPAEPRPGFDHAAPRTATADYTARPMATQPGDRQTTSAAPQVIEGDYYTLPAAPGEVEQFARVYRQAGSLRPAAAALGISYYKAQQLYQQARSTNLID